MSHSTTGISGQPANRSPWTSLPTNDAFDIDSELLLNTKQARSRRLSISSTSESSSIDTPRAVALQFDVEKPRTPVPATWLPYTLRAPILMALAFVSLALAIVLIVLCRYSAKNRGLGNDDGSMGLLVGWRYTPTIIAVLFAQSCSIIAEDVKRTEAFARMASLEPIEAKFTLFYVPGAWWTTVFEGFSQKRSGGHKRLVLAFSSLAAGLIVLIIPTFSSSVFIAKEVAFPSSVQFQRYTSDLNGSLPLVPRRNTYFHAISGFLYNASTSIWATDSYAILPFQPANHDTKGLSLGDGLWEAATKVIQMESNCVSMTMTDKTAIRINYFSADSQSVESKGFKLRSEDGCEIQIQSAIVNAGHDNGFMFSVSSDNYTLEPLTQYGGVFWTNMSSSYISWQDLVQEHGQNPPVNSSGDRVLKQWASTFIYSLSDQCRGRDLLLVTPPWFTFDFPYSSQENVTEENEWQESYWANFTVRAELCTPTYYEATLPVTLAVSGALFELSFDAIDLNTQRTPVSQSLLDLDRLNELTFGGSWSKYMATDTSISDEGVFDGVSMLLAKPFAYNQLDMMTNATLPLEASKLRSRFLSELLLSSVVEADVPNLESVTGQVTLTERRIMTVAEVAILLAVLFLLAASYLSIMVWAASTGRRPLQLRTDPATTIGTALLVTANSSLASELQGLESSGRDDFHNTMGSEVYTLHASKIAQKARSTEVIKSVTSTTPPKKSRRWYKGRTPKKMLHGDWRPVMLHKRWLVTLLTVLVAIAIALLVLRRLATEGRLYRTAFVYQADLGLFNTSFSPHSVVTALIAVVIAFSWDGIDKPMRTLQPYLSMSRGASEAPRGALLSYRSSYWAWAAVKASQSNHWILCLVTIGTTLSQVCKVLRPFLSYLSNQAVVVSMAAVFEQRTSIHTQATHGLRSLVLREQPFSFAAQSYNSSIYFSESFLNTSNADWLYNALDEITQNTAPPPWTHNEWIFTPVKLGSFTDNAVSQKIRSKGKYQDTSNPSTFSTNITITTSALRSRLECSSIRVPASGWLDRAEDVFPDSINETITGYVLPAVLFENEPYKTPVFTAPRRMACCKNGTIPGQRSAIAYWSSNSSMVEKPANGTENVQEPSAWYQNFTIKWIVGPTALTLVSNEVHNLVTTSFGFADEPILYFTEKPKMTIINCIPVIEQAIANITLHGNTSQVLASTIIGKPQPAPGAWGYSYDSANERLEINITHTNIDVNNDTTTTANEFYRSDGNVSYGVFFTSQLLTAPHIVKPVPASSLLVFNGTIEDLSSERFSVRDSDRGLNMDFMSYSNFYLANKDPDALLDPDVLFRHSEKTFQTFFKHFVAKGAWPKGDGEGGMMAYEPFMLNDDQLNGTISERIELLAMNETATWLSLGILFFLIIILVVLIVSLQIVYPSTSMQRPVECLADVLSMVAGSDTLVRLAHERGEEGLEKSGVMTRLGWFRDRRGVVRWGIEVVDAEGIEWLDGPE